MKKTLPKKKASSKKPERLGIAGNMSACREKTGLDLHKISALKEMGAGGFNSNNTIDCDALLQWCADNPEKVAQISKGPDIKLERALDIRANRMLKEQKYRERDKQSFPAEVVHRLFHRENAAITRKCLSAPMGVVAEINAAMGLTREQIPIVLEIVTKAFNSIPEEMNQGQWGEIGIEGEKAK